jgi:hypothetical protein
MNDPLVTVTERLYVEEPGRPRYVLAHPGARIRRSVLEKYGYAVPTADAKRRPRKTVEDKAVKSPAKAKDDE